MDKEAFFYHSLSMQLPTDWLAWLARGLLHSHLDSLQPLWQDSGSKFWFSLKFAALALSGTDHCTSLCKEGGESVNRHLVALTSLQSTLPNIVSHQNGLQPVLLFLCRGNIAGCNIVEKDGDRGVHLRLIHVSNCLLRDSLFCCCRIGRLDIGDKWFTEKAD